MKHLIFCFVISGLTNLTFGQTKDIDKNFVLKGEINGIDTGTIIIYFPNKQNQMVEDTAAILNGMFLLQGEISQPTQCGLKTLYQDNFASIFIEPKKQTIYLQDGDFYHFKMDGSYTQRQADTLQAALEEPESQNAFLRHIADSLNDVYSTEKDTVKQQYYLNRLDSIRALMIAVAEEQVKIKTTFIEQHPNSYVSSAILRGLFINYRNVNSEQAATLYNRFSSIIQNSSDGKLIEKELARQQKNRIGSLIPEINVRDVNNKFFSFSNLIGKPILIDFWASWCVPCRRAIPHLKELYQQYHSLGFEVVLISIDEEESDWRKAIQDESIDSYSNILATAEMKDYFVNAQMPIPNQILIGRDGKILWNSIYEQHNNTIDNLLDKEFAEKN